MKTPEHRPRPQAFTYTELMVAISIIGILAAILFPVFAKAREKGRMAACQSQLQQISAALMIYARDYNNLLPPNKDNLGPLYPYLRDPQVFRCPTDLPFKPVSFQGNALANISYGYFGGLTLDADQASRTAVMCDVNQGLHNEGANFLFLDGRVKFFAESQVRGRVTQPALGIPYENLGDKP